MKIFFSQFAPKNQQLTGWAIISKIAYPANLITSRNSSTTISTKNNQTHLAICYTFAVYFQFCVRITIFNIQKRLSSKFIKYKKNANTTLGPSALSVYIMFEYFSVFAQKFHTKLRFEFEIWINFRMCFMALRLNCWTANKRTKQKNGKKIFISEQLSLWNIISNSVNIFRQFGISTGISFEFTCEFIYQTWILE